MKTVAILVSILGLLSACSEPVVTYHGQSRAIIETHCVSCHQEGGITPFALDTWADVKPMANAALDAIEAGTMPPWGMESDCRDVVNAIGLSEEDKETMRAWKEGGFLQGDPSTYVAPILPEPEEIPAADIVLSLDSGYLPPTDKVDDYRCLVLDYTFDKDTFVTTSEVLPDRLDLVHHVIIYLVPEEERSALNALIDDDEEPGFACFGDAGISNAQMLTGWAPGTVRISPSDKTAMRVPAGSQVIMQMHYNNANGTTPEDNHPDSTQVALWTMPDGQVPDYLIHLLPVADLGIDIPSGDPASTHTSIYRYPVDTTIVGVAPHMHLLGSEIRTQILRQDGTQECLTDLGSWDFNWQRSYMFAEEAVVPLSISDQIELTCVYDNSAENQAIVNGELQEPRDVQWGDGSFDEMCLNYLIVANPYYGGGQSGVCAGFPTCFADCAPGDGLCRCLAGGRRSGDL